jgi:hypothetical protein
MHQLNLCVEVGSTKPRCLMSFHQFLASNPPSSFTQCLYESQILSSESALCNLFFAPWSKIVIPPLWNIVFISIISIVSFLFRPWGLKKISWVTNWTVMYIQVWFHSCQLLSIIEQKSLSNLNGFLHLRNNFKDFNFPRSEVVWSRKDHVRCPAGVVCITGSQICVTVHIRVTLIRNINAMATPESWAIRCFAINCIFGLNKRKLHRCSARWVSQCEQKTPKRTIRFPWVRAVPWNWSKPAKDITSNIFNNC